MHRCVRGVTLRDLLMPNPLFDRRRDTRARVLRYTLMGLRPREIALLTGVSITRVYDLVRELRDAGELSEETA